MARFIKSHSYQLEESEDPQPVLESIVEITIVAIALAIWLLTCVAFVDFIKGVSL